MKQTDEITLSDLAYESIRTAILEGRLTPGTPLSRRKLADGLGMSAVPVGDAIARLEMECLVESRPRAGTRVRLATAEEIHGNYVLREALETHSARLFAESATAAQRKSLLRAAKRLDLTYNSLAPKPFVPPESGAAVERQHMDFHMMIARAVGVPVFSSAIERSRVLLFNWLFSRVPAFEPFPERWHRDLAQVLTSGTPAQAAEAMRTHVRFRINEATERSKTIVAEPARMLRGPQRAKGESQPRTSR